MLPWLPTHLVNLAQSFCVSSGLWLIMQPRFVFHFLSVLLVLSDAQLCDDRESPQLVHFKRLRGQLFVGSPVCTCSQLSMKQLPSYLWSYLSLAESRTVLEDPGQSLFDLVSSISALLATSVLVSAPGQSFLCTSRGLLCCRCRCPDHTFSSAPYRSSPCPGLCRLVIVSTCFLAARNTAGGRSQLY